MYKKKISSIHIIIIVSLVILLIIAILLALNPDTINIVINIWQFNYEITKQ